MKNIVYVGTLAALLDIDMDVVEQHADGEVREEAGADGVEPQGDPARLRLREGALRVPAADPAREDGRDRATRSSSTATPRPRSAALYAGATVAAWYPITPSTSVLDAFKAFCEKYRTDKETGEQRYCILQAEDELAAIGMVIGAAWNGARAFTSTSGPGISLMNELIGLAYYAEIPAVIVDVQRVGPSTGMPTRTQQGDILLCAYASHGDTKHILLFPANPRGVLRLRGRRRSISPSASRRRSSCSPISTSA